MPMRVFQYALLLVLGVNLFQAPGTYIVVCSCWQADGRAWIGYMKDIGKTVNTIAPWNQE